MSIFKRFHHSGLPKVVCGVDEMWSPELFQLRGHDDGVRSVAFSPDGSKIISGSDDMTNRVWDANTGIEMLLRSHYDSINSVAFSPDGSKIIAGSDDMTIRLWSASTGIEMFFPPLRGHDDSVYSVAFSPDGSKIISGSDDMTIRVWDASTANMLPRPQISADDSPRPSMGKLTWFINFNTGRYMGILPVGTSLHPGTLHGSTFVGWTGEYKLVLIHFPEQ